MNDEWVAISVGIGGFASLIRDEDKREGNAHIGGENILVRRWIAVAFNLLPSPEDAEALRLLYALPPEQRVQIADTAESLSLLATGEPSVWVSYLRETLGME